MSPLGGGQEVDELPRQCFVSCVADDLSCGAPEDLYVSWELDGIACVRPDVLEGVPPKYNVNITRVYQPHQAATGIGMFDDVRADVLDQTSLAAYVVPNALQASTCGCAYSNALLAEVL